MRELLLYLSTPLVMFIFAAVFGVLFARDTQRRENLALATGWGLLSLGFFISLLSPQDWGRMIVTITHVPYTLGAVAMSWGVLHRVGVKPPAKVQLAIAASGFAVLILVQTFGNTIVADLYVTNLTCGAIVLMTAQLLGQSSSRDGVERFLLVMTVITAAQFFIRPVLSMMFDGPIDASNYRESIYYLALNWIFAFGTVLFGIAQLAGAVKDQFNAMRHSTSTDVLSGLLMRGEFEAQVEAALLRASRKRCSVALVVGDIDHFKQVNDIWGHQVGDRAIASFGKMIGETIRSTDIAGRIGGEEFCLLVWNADEAVARGLAERLRARTGQLEIGKDGSVGSVGSVGGVGSVGSFGNG